MHSELIGWGREIAAMTQTGLTYATDPYDIARYRRLRELAAEMLARAGGVPAATVARIFDAESGHATPKVDVRAFVLRDGKVLLVRERRDGRWSLPGGWADVGETPREAIEREVVEESGYAVRTGRLLAVYDKRKHPHPPQAFYVYKLIFEATIVGGAPRESDETDGIAFFGADEIPPLSEHRIVPSQLARLFALAADATAPTESD